MRAPADHAKTGPRWARAKRRASGCSCASRYLSAPAGQLVAATPRLPSVTHPGIPQAIPHRAERRTFLKTHVPNRGPAGVRSPVDEL
jgi:hypothetical protein